MFTTLAEEEMKKMIKTLKAFKNGDLNIIVSTSVLEEGVDIRICNLVIRFDKPKTFRPYVQSRGRARAKESNYILLCTNQEKQDFNYILEDILQIVRNSKIDTFGHNSKLNAAGTHNIYMVILFHKMLISTEIALNY